MAVDNTARGLAGKALSAGLADGSVTYAKIQNVSATDKLLGRSTAGAGVVEEIALTAAGRALIDDADAASQRTTLGLGNVDNVAVLGKQAIPIPAGAMKAATTNGAAAGTVETTTNKNMLVTLDFDTATAEIAQFYIPMPKGWNEGTITFKAIWKHAATTTNFGVAWGLSAVALSDDDAGDVAFGTEIVVTDTGGTTNDIYHTAESAAVTIAGTPTTGDLVNFKVRRVVSDGADTMAIDAGLIAIVLYITTDAGNDA